MAANGLVTDTFRFVSDVHDEPGMTRFPFNANTGTPTNDPVDADPTNDGIWDMGPLSNPGGAWQSSQCQLRCRPGQRRL